MYCCYGKQKIDAAKVLHLTLDDNVLLANDEFRTATLRKKVKTSIQNEDDEEKLSHAKSCTVEQQ